MPNASGRAALKDRRTTRNRKSTDNDQETTMTTAVEDTVTDVPDFTSLITAAPEDYKPDRSPAGRKRTPSQFETVLPGLKDQGWQRIRHDRNVVMQETDSGQQKATAESVKGSNAHVIKRELQKAQHFLGLGMDLNITAEYVEFRVRDLQKRERAAADEAKRREEAGEDSSDDDE